MVEKFKALEAHISAIVLQDRKRLPARFFAAISGALNTRAA